MLGGEVLIGSGKFRIVGRVTMDQLMVDVGEADVTVGDEVVIFGRLGKQELSANELAARLHTIPYELFCAIGQRVERTYVP
jgi:alanine racemase